MMHENGNMKELPHLPAHPTCLEDQMAEYTQARVTLWLDANGWSQVSPIFEGKWSRSRTLQFQHSRYASLFVLRNFEDPSNITRFISQRKAYAESDSSPCQ